MAAASSGARPGGTGRLVNLQGDSLYVRLLEPQTGQLLREYFRQKRGGYRIRNEDYPPRRPRGTSPLLARAGRAGSHLGAFCQALHPGQGEWGVRRIRGVLSLAKKFGAAAVEEAGAAALELEVHEDRCVRRYRERRPPAPRSWQQVDPLIRERGHDRDRIPQGYRVLYRETPARLDELAEAARDGTRKASRESLVAGPRLIIDDFGMRTLPLTAAEALREIIMRRYERASTRLTSNRPVEDGGKLLGDAAAVSPLLDRLLHHRPVLQGGPRSWRTKTDLPPEPSAG